MSIVTTYTCDRCGHKQIKPEQMWEVCIRYRHYDTSYGSSGSDRNKQLWCRACCDALQIISNPPPEKPTETPTPIMTLEDQIREVMREEIEAATGAAR